MKIVSKYFVLLIMLYSDRPLAQGTSGLSRTGIYEKVVHVAYDSASKELSGFISAESYGPDGKTIYQSCDLLFSGICANFSNCKIAFYIPNNADTESTGVIRLDGSNAILISDEVILFCQNIFDFHSSDGYPFLFSTFRPYKFCRAIKQNKVRIYKEPTDSSATRMYLIKDDFVSILKEKEGWVYIEYQGKKDIYGWIRKENLFPSIP